MGGGGTKRRQNPKCHLGAAGSETTGVGEGSTSFRSTKSRPLFCLSFSDTYLVGLRGRFLAHKCIILET